MTDLKDTFTLPKSDWRSNKAVVLQALLEASPPWRVADFLRKRAENLDSTYSDETDEKVEVALLERGEPLIDIALARWAMYDATVRALWSRPRPENGKSAIHLALLSNELAARHAWWFPTNLYGKRNDYAPIAELTSDEIYALFSNPRLSGDFIADFLAGEKVWEHMEDTRRMEAVASLGKRLWTHGENENRYDGYADYRHNSVYNNAWKLAASVPVTNQWANVLGSIYCQLKPREFNFDDPVSVAERWTEAAEEEAKHFEKGWLSGYQQVRMGLARLDAHKDRKAAAQLLQSGDLAIRLGAYAAMEVTAEDVSSFAQRDGKHAVDAMIENESIWRDEKKREALRQACWDAPDPRSTMDLPQTFNAKQERMAEQHPAWFKEEDLPARLLPAPTDPASKKLHALEAALQQQRMLLFVVIAALALLLFRG